jgi:hypothetical protein
VREGAPALAWALLPALRHLRGGPALLDNGVRITVPPFVGQDEDVVVNTETMEYSERA